MKRALSFMLCLFLMMAINPSSAYGEFHTEVNALDEILFAYPECFDFSLAIGRSAEDVKPQPIKSEAYDALTNYIDRFGATDYACVAMAMLCLYEQRDAEFLQCVQRMVESQRPAIHMMGQYLHVASSGIMTSQQLYEANQMISDEFETLFLTDDHILEEAQSPDCPKFVGTRLRGWLDDIYIMSLWMQLGYCLDANLRIDAMEHMDQFSNLPATDKNRRYIMFAYCYKLLIALELNDEALSIYEEYP